MSQWGIFTFKRLFYHLKKKNLNLPLNWINFHCTVKIFIYTSHNILMYQCLVYFLDLLISYWPQKVSRNCHKDHQSKPEIKHAFLFSFYYFVFYQELSANIWPIKLYIQDKEVNAEFICLKNSNWGDASFWS